jgi:hypothetical protein
MTAQAKGIALGDAVAQAARQTAERLVAVAPFKSG